MTRVPTALGELGQSQGVSDFQWTTVFCVHVLLDLGKVRARNDLRDDLAQCPLASDEQVKTREVTPVWGGAVSPCRSGP